MENIAVLKLDSSFKPIEIIGWEEAIILTWLNKAWAVEYTDKWVHSATKAFQIPSVIVLHNYIRRFPFRLSCNRRNVFWRDSNQCQYCAKVFKFDDLTMDHVNPKSRGGDKSWENIVTSCKGCNSKKRDRTPKEAQMPLIRRPYSPRVNLLDLNRSVPIHDDWKMFF